MKNVIIRQRLGGVCADQFVTELQIDGSRGRMAACLMWMDYISSIYQTPHAVESMSSSTHTLIGHVGNV